MGVTEEVLVGVRCPKCGGHEVGYDAYSRFNPVLQEWELGGQYDNGWCSDCGEVEPEEYLLEGTELEEVRLVRLQEQ